jgi:hypothetical protein
MPQLCAMTAWSVIAELGLECLVLWNLVHLVFCQLTSIASKTNSKRIAQCLEPHVHGTASRRHLHAASSRAADTFRHVLWERNARGNKAVVRGENAVRYKWRQVVLPLLSWTGATRLHLTDWCSDWPILLLSVLFFVGDHGDVKRNCASVARDAPLLCCGGRSEWHLQIVDAFCHHSH